MPLRIVRRKDRSGALTIVGTVAGQAVRRRAQSDNPAIAREEAAALEAEILRTEWHGERRTSRSFAEAVTSYVAADRRSTGTLARLHRILRALGDMPLRDVDQTQIERLCRLALKPGATPATIRRGVIVPVRAVLNHAAFLGWCEPPRFKSPKQLQGRTKFLLPDEAERLIAAAATHLKPLLTFLIGTGARMSEALYLNWQDVDLVGGRAIFWETKNGKRRVADLPPRVVEVLFSSTSERISSVFRTPAGIPYADTGAQYGGQIKTAWRGAIRRAGLDPELTPHSLRHSWASYHYALHKDLLALKEAGGWSSVALVERYAHLMPAVQEEAIRRFLGIELKRERWRA